MLLPRILTALLLFGVFFPALFWASARAWAIGAAFVAALAVWEWGGLMQKGQLARFLSAIIMLAVCTTIPLAVPEILEPHSSLFAGSIFGLASFFWFVIVPFWLSYRWVLPKTGSGWVIGALVVFPTWMALIQLREHDPAHLLAVMAAVWIADIAAYFSGRMFGRHKLAPSISPGKTWEGAVGGALGVIVYGYVLSDRFVPVTTNIGLLFIGLLIFAAMSVVGDLFESMLKRQVGLKDSSALLPGHGGILDRIDSLTPTLPLVALAQLLMK